MSNNLKPSTRELLNKNAKRSARLWHASVRQGSSISQALTHNVQKRKRMADAIRKVRGKSR